MIQYHSIWDNTLKYNTIHFDTLLYNAMHCNMILYDILYNTRQSNIIWYNTVQVHVVHLSFQNMYKYKFEYIKTSYAQPLVQYQEVCSSTTHLVFGNIVYHFGWKNIQHCPDLAFCAYKDLCVCVCTLVEITAKSGDIVIKVCPRGVDWGQRKSVVFCDPSQRESVSCCTSINTDRLLFWVSEQAVDVPHVVL